MSDTPDDRQAQGVSMRKDAATAQGAGSGTDGKPQVPIPWTVNAASIGAGFGALFTLVQAVSLRLSSTSQLAQWEIYRNDNAGKKKVSPYTLADATHDADRLKSGALVQAVVVALALAILGYSLRRARGASGARWALLIVLVLTAAPLSVVPTAGPFPAVPKVVGVLMGLAAIVTIVGIILPKSMNYFRECKAATRPAGAPERPGLAGLFGPRGAAAQRGMASGEAAAERARRGAAGGSAEDYNPARAKAKAKVRADADAVAKGAELARARAKASKSRRSDSV